MTQGRDKIFSHVSLCSPLRRRVAGAVLFTWVAAASWAIAEPPPAGALRVRGLIDRDTRWSGHVLVTDDASVQGATLTIAAGTIVEFARPANGGARDANDAGGASSASVDATAGGATLTIGSDGRLPGWLTLEATSERPIVFRTREGCAPGAIVIHAHDLAGRRRSPDEPPTTAGLELSNVMLERLGGSRAASLEIHLRDPAAVVLVAGCTFERCGPLRLVQAGPASAYVAHNRMARSAGPTCMEVVRGSDPLPGGGKSPAGGAMRANAPRSIAPAGPSELRVHDNMLPGAIRTVAVAVEIDSNVLIGESAAILLEGAAAGELIVRDNYVHCTARRADDGGSALVCGDSQARVIGNIVRGGAKVVARGSLHMARNVLVAPRELDEPGGRRTIATAVVADLPAGAVFEGNLIVGPAHTLLRAGGAGKAASSATAATIIRGNTFDGGRAGSRGVVLAGAGPVDVHDNVFASTWPAVLDEATAAAMPRAVDYNARSEPAEAAYRRVRVAGGAGAGAHDVTSVDIGLTAMSAALAALAELETSLAAGRIDVPTARRRLLAAYAPPPDSPLIGAGRPDERGTRGTLGAVYPEK